MGIREAEVLGMVEVLGVVEVTDKTKVLGMVEVLVEVEGLLNEQIADMLKGMEKGVEEQSVVGLG